MRKLTKLTTIGTELELEELAQVQGGQIFPDPNYNPYAIHIDWKQVASAAQAAYQIGKSVWHTISSWF